MAASAIADLVLLLGFVGRTTKSPTLAFSVSIALGVAVVVVRLGFRPLRNDP